MKKVMRSSFYHRHKKAIKHSLLLTLAMMILVAGLCLANYAAINRQNQKRLQGQLQAAEKRTNNLAAENAKNKLTTPTTEPSSNPANASTNISSTPQSSAIGGSGSTFSLSQTQDGCGTPYETTYSTVRRYDSTKLWNSPDIVTGGVNGKTALCKVNGAMVYKVIVAPIDKVIISGSATSMPTPTPAVTSEPRDKNGLTAAERSALCAKLVSGNAGSSSTYQMYCVNY